MAQHHGRNLRKGRASLSNHIYLITTVTHKRQPLFTDFHCARSLIRTIRNTEQICKIESLSFVIMPDHMHWLFSLGNKSHLSQVIAKVKRISAFRVNEINNRTGSRVWQPGFHDYALRDEGEIKDVARYIVANPLRAGLVNKIGDYPFWDAVWL